MASKTRYWAEQLLNAEFGLAALPASATLTLRLLTSMPDSITLLGGNELAVSGYEAPVVANDDTVFGYAENKLTNIVELQFGSPNDDAASVVAVSIEDENGNRRRVAYPAAPIAVEANSPISVQVGELTIDEA